MLSLLFIVKKKKKMWCDIVNPFLITYCKKQTNKQTNKSVMYYHISIYVLPYFLYVSLLRELKGKIIYVRLSEAN